MLKQSFESVLLVGNIQRLAYDIKDGLVPFSEYDGSQRGVVYDDKKPLYKECVSDGDEENLQVYAIVLNSCVDSDHHDIINTYDDLFEDVAFDLYMGDFESYICVDCENSGGSIIINLDGTWRTDLL